MLKKINRGLKRSDFEASKKNGKMLQTPLFGVSVIKTLPPSGHLPLTGQVEPVQIGFVISKKISKKAVERNKIKRILSQVIKNKLPNNLKLVVLVKKNIIEAKIDELEKCWSMIYEKIGVKTTNNL